MRFRRRLEILVLYPGHDRLNTGIRGEKVGGEYEGREGMRPDEGSLSCLATMNTHGCQRPPGGDRLAGIGRSRTLLAKSHILIDFAPRACTPTTAIDALRRDACIAPEGIPARWRRAERHPLNGNWRTRRFNLFNFEWSKGRKKENLLKVL